MTETTRSTLADSYRYLYDLRLCADGDVTMTLPWHREVGHWIAGGPLVDLVVEPSGVVRILDPIAGHYVHTTALPWRLRERARAFAELVGGGARP